MRLSNDIWIAGINTMHNASTCLLKNGEIIFHIEEERLSRVKYDEHPFLGIAKIKEFTDKLDYFAVPKEIAHYGWFDNPYVAYAKKLGLIHNKSQLITNNNPAHHEYHAAGAFYNSGFDDAICIVIDGAGAMFRYSDIQYGNEINSIFYMSGVSERKLLHKVITNKSNLPTSFSDDKVIKFTNYPGIGMIYNSLSVGMGHSTLECGKSMGLSSYGKKDETIPPVYMELNGERIPNRNMFVYDEINYAWTTPVLQNVNQYRKENLCYAIQRATEQEAKQYIHSAIKLSKCNNIILTGGFGLNCVANYEYLLDLPEKINLFIDPPAYDGGLSIGVAKLTHALVTGNKPAPQKDYYLGPKPKYNYTLTEEFTCRTATYKDIVDLILSGNIIAMYQGRSESGPRALGNRSILFDPRLPNGKDIVNAVKNREWYRPFAGTILKEFANDYFDMRGLEESPFMMYAVNVLEDKKSIIPAITHVDGTCRIQTVTEEQNKHYYNLISEFNKQTGVPILFNTSFNLGGDPIVETIDEAMETLRKSKLRYLYLPEINNLLVKE
jgi:carbamoyltransferase